jgi:dihydroxyacid dehydratase/phosphogluconate dehydratase
MRSLWLPFWEVRQTQLCILSLAHSVDIEITLKDFQDISDKTPLLADLKWKIPYGRLT